MKNHAFGKLGITADKLKELLNLPEDVEILEVKFDVMTGQFEIIVISKEPIEKLTVKIKDGNSNIRRVRVPLPEKD